MTEYVVLRSTDDENWFHASTISARSAQSAVRVYLAEGSEGGRFVAVPARSWKPVTVKVETKTALKFS